MYQFCSLQKESTQRYKIWLFPEKNGAPFPSWTLLSVLKLRSRLYTKTVSSAGLCAGEQKLQNDKMTIKKE